MKVKKKKKEPDLIQFKIQRNFLVGFLQRFIRFYWLQMDNRSDYILFGLARISVLARIEN